MARWLALALESAAPAAGGVVMGTGICSIALADDGEVAVSRVLLGIAMAIWVALALLLLVRAASEREAVRIDARQPASLTAVAGTAVLGTRLAILGTEQAAIALLVIALLAWAALLAPVLRAWRTPTVGASFMVVVSTESLAALAATVAVHDRSPWLLIAALAPLAAGFIAYLFVLARFDSRQLTSASGDHWITGGALAITTLAAAGIAGGAASLGLLGGGGLVATIALALWAVSVLWLPALVLGELLAPRLGYDVLRWSTVFPIGMYAACSFAVGRVAPAAGIVSFARVWVWAAVAVWGLTLVGMLRRTIGLLRAIPGAPEC